MRKKMFTDLDRPEGLSEFDAFKRLATIVLNVPKSEIDKREEEEKQAKQKTQKNEKDKKK